MVQRYAGGPDGTGRVGDGDCSFHPHKPLQRTRSEQAPDKRVRPRHSQGQTRTCRISRAESAVPSIVLKKSFWGDQRKFLEPLMRFARGDMRDHTVSHRIDYCASYRRYGVLPRRSRLKIKFCEIFGVVRFSTFATLSPQQQTSISAQYANPLLELSCALPRSRAKPSFPPKFCLSLWGEFIVRADEALPLSASNRRRSKEGEQNREVW
jgi:hypothetical protein